MIHSPDFDPTAADLAEVADLAADADVDLSDLLTEDADEPFDFDDDYAPRDDRWSEGVPSWSAWA